MIALFDFMPAFCPRCGGPLGPWDRAETGDLLAWASHYCLSCGMKFAVAPTDNLLAAADNADSDLRKYVEG